MTKPTEIHKELYKYMKVDEFLLRLLINRQLFLQKPKYFNDPFDSTFSVFNTDENIEEEWDEYTKNIKNAINSPTQRKLETAAKAFRFQNEQNELIQENYGVSCFSRIPDHILMWSHYADKHQGVCIEFDWNKNKEQVIPNKVTYEPTLPVIPNLQGLTSNAEVFTKKVLTTKLKDWEYEAEYRIFELINDTGNRLKQFSDEVITKVIFGDKINENDIHTITTLLNYSVGNGHIKTQRAYLDQRTGTLEIR